MSWELVLPLLGVGSKGRYNALNLRGNGRLLHSSSVILIFRCVMVQIRCRLPIVLGITQPLPLFAFELMEIIFLYRWYFGYFLLAFAAFSIITGGPFPWFIGNNLWKMLEYGPFVLRRFFDCFHLLARFQYLFVLWLLVFLNNRPQKSRYTVSSIVVFFVFLRRCDYYLWRLMPLRFFMIIRANYTGLILGNRDEVKVDNIGS